MTTVSWRWRSILCFLFTATTLILVHIEVHTITYMSGIEWADLDSMQYVLINIYWYIFISFIFIYLLMISQIHFPSRLGQSLVVCTPKITAPAIHPQYRCCGRSRLSDLFILPSSCARHGKPCLHFFNGLTLESMLHLFLWLLCICVLHINEFKGFLLGIFVS